MVSWILTHLTNRQVKHLLNLNYIWKRRLDYSQHPQTNYHLLKSVLCFPNKAETPAWHAEYLYDSHTLKVTPLSPSKAASLVPTRDEWCGMRALAPHLCWLWGQADLEGSGTMSQGQTDWGSFPVWHLLALWPWVRDLALPRHKLLVCKVLNVPFRFVVMFRENLWKLLGS